MAHLTFWRKPGCVGNARQIALLNASGHTLELRDLGAETWTAARLRPFFGATPVAAWFNPSAPRVKSGELRPETLTEADAMALLIAHPLLIRRPLIECDGTTVAGFDPDRIAAWIGLASGLPSVGEACPRPDMPSCQPPTEAKQELISE
jgi:nitrogenase-associated protein